MQFAKMSSSVVFVTFCKSDFTIIDVTDIYSITCWDETGDIFACYQSNVLNLVACPDAEGNAYPIRIYPEFNENLFFTTPTEEFTHVFIPTKGENDYLNNFGFVRTEGIITPKGLIRSASGKTSLLDYTFKTYNESRRSIPNIEFYDDDWDAETLVYIEKLEENKYSLEFDTPLNTWRNAFSSTSHLQISDMVKSEDRIIISGIFRGNLDYNEINLKNAQDFNGFIAMVDFDGTIIQCQTIQNTTSKLDIREGNGQFLISGEASSSWTSIDNQPAFTLNPGGLFEFHFNEQTSLNFTSLNISTTGSVHLLKSISNKDLSRTTYLFKGAGTLECQATVFNLLDEYIFLITIDNITGLIQWSKNIAQAVSSEEISLVYDDSTNLYLTMTFSSNLYENEEWFSSAGGKDILIGKIDTIGNYLALRSYGSPDDEIVKICFFDNGILYFGGEISGLSAERQLGRSTLAYLGNNSDPTISKAYISFVTDRDLEVPAYRSAESNEDLLEVYPNPFSDELIIRKQSSKNDLLTITVLDVLGKVIVEQHEKSIAGTNQFRIPNLSRLPAGIFYIQLINSEGQVWVHKVVKN